MLPKGGIDVGNVFGIRCNFTRVNWLGKRGRLFKPMILSSSIFQNHLKSCSNTDWCLPPLKVLILMVLEWGSKFVFQKFPGDAEFCAGEHTLGKNHCYRRSSSICKSRELKTWCIQKALSSCTRSSGEDSSATAKTGLYPWSKN